LREKVLAIPTTSLQALLLKVALATDTLRLKEVDELGVIADWRKEWPEPDA
jgi:hypothetical protein